jgi:hypothetical protein
VQVGHPVPFQDARAFEFDPLGAAVTEERRALTQEHGYQMDLELVEDPGLAGELRRGGTVEHHVALAGGLLGRGDRRPDVRRVRDERPLRDVDAGLVPGDDEDGYAVVVVATPNRRPARRSAGRR